MLIAVDVGNTHIVIGAVDGDHILTVARLRTDIHKTEYEYAVLFKQHLDFAGVKYADCTDSIISSVVPPLTHTLAKAIWRLTGGESMIIGSGIKTGLNILIDNPAQLGGDLVTGAVAALELVKPPIIIIDMGTATKLSVVDAKANYIGCSIYPGVNLSLTALSRGTSQLPYISLEAPKSCIGKNSVDSMKSGIVFGSAAMLDGMIDRIEEELGSSASLVATGGIAPSIVPYCRHNILLREDLLLKGLSIIYARNRKKK